MLAASAKAPRTPSGSPPAASPASSTATARTRLHSFDGAVQADARVQRPDRYRFWGREYPPPSAGPAMPRGAGLSYAAASFRPGGLAIEHTAFDRILDFDAAAGVVEVEAGVRLAQLFDFLGPRGWYLPVQPGHGRLTVGGCIAADVHGKNQARDGTFITQVASLELFHPDHGRLSLSREAELDLFRLTCGGFGLTGHILSARLRAQPLPGIRLRVERRPVTELAELPAALPHAALGTDFVFSWHDLASPAIPFGAGFIQRSSFRPGPDLPFPLLGEPPDLGSPERGRWGPCWLGRSSIRALNFLYRHRRPPASTPLDDGLFPAHRTQLYFRLFGRAGFHEYQVIIPPARFAEFNERLRSRLRERPAAVTLCSGKLFAGRAELLRFCGEGVCLALNFPRNAASGPLLRFLDELTAAVGARPSLVKDSRLPRAVAEATYPEIDVFRNRLAGFDPRRRFRSELSERLGL